MSFDHQRIYELLPAILRIRDHQEGKPLEALLAVIAEQTAILEENLDQLYDDLFVETCAQWVVPYIGELIKARHLFIFPDASVSARAQVANTIAYRRRKGTAAVLEQLARDVTGWNASVREYFQVLATTQYLNHLRPNHLAMADLRNTATLADLDTPFDGCAHRVDVRRIETGGGRHNIPNIGLFLWRINSFGMTRAPAYLVDARRFCFNVLGLDAPLYNKPETETDISHLAEPVNVPMPLSRRRLKDGLGTYYGLDDQGGLKSMLIYLDGTPLLDDGAVSVPPAATVAPIRICDLGDLFDLSGNVIGWQNLPPDAVAIDPVLGRIAFPQNSPPPGPVQVSFHHGFSAKLGGGTYGRLQSVDTDLQPVVRVPSDAPTLQDALDLVSAAGGVVEIESNQTFSETPQITVGDSATVELRAADERRPLLRLSDDMVVIGGTNARLSINGMLISGGRVHVPALDASGNANALQRLTLKHCTLVPGSVPVQAHSPLPLKTDLVVAASHTALELTFCITGRLAVAETARVTVDDSIIDAGGPRSVAFTGPDGQSAGAPMTIRNATVIGRVHTRIMEQAENTIFLADRSAADTWPAPVYAQRLQQGCVRYSYVPTGAIVPRPYRCQPGNSEDPARIRPVFTSLRYGDPGYAQLSRRCAAEIVTGADDESEMGAFHHLYQPQRIGNLRAALDEYLRFSLEAGIFFAS